MCSPHSFSRQSSSSSLSTVRKVKFRRREGLLVISISSLQVGAGNYRANPFTVYKYKSSLSKNSAEAEVAMWDQIMAVVTWYSYLESGWHLVDHIRAWPMENCLQQIKIIRQNNKHKTIAKWEQFVKSHYRITAPLGSSVLSPGSRVARSADSSVSLVGVRAPEYAILGQTVHLYCNFSLPPPHTNFYTLKVRAQTPGPSHTSHSQPQRDQGRLYGIKSAEMWCLNKTRVVLKWQSNTSIHIQVPHNKLYSWGVKLGHRALHRGYSFISSMMKQNLTCSPLFQWFLNDAEVYRYVPEAKRELQRMVFNTASVKIDLESSKMIGEHEHLLVLQSVSRRQSGEYKCQVMDIREWIMWWRRVLAQVTMDTPPFQFIQSSAYLSIMVLPERHPVISGNRICLQT